MKNVLEHARLLGEAILSSDVYLTLKARERDFGDDPKAAAAMQQYLDCKKVMDSLLSQDQKDHDALIAAAEAMEAAEKDMDNVPSVAALQAAKDAYNTMLDNMNQVLQLVVNGTTESGCSGSCSSCGGSCGTCGGCE